MKDRMDLCHWITLIILQATNMRQYLAPLHGLNRVLHEAILPNIYAYDSTSQQLSFPRSKPHIGKHVISALFPFVQAVFAVPLFGGKQPSFGLPREEQENLEGISYQHCIEWKSQDLRISPKL